MRRVRASACAGYLAALACGSGVLALASAAVAQSASPGSAAAPDGRLSQKSPAKPASQLEEIVVTAQKRSQKLQKTPLAVTALSGAFLRSHDLTDARQLGEYVPDVRISTNGAATDINIRGIGNSSFGANGDPPTSFNVDGVYVARPLASTDILYDIQRVEVLRGPQGTLYGRNSDAGAVNVITNKPTSDFGGNAEVELGDYGERRGEGAINVPITDTLAVRGAFQVLSHDGYISDGTFDADTQTARVSALWKPLITTSLLVTGDYAYRGGLGSQQIVPLTPRNADPFTSAVPGNSFGLDGTQKGITADLEQGLGPVTATIIANYRDEDDNQRGDAGGDTYTSEIDRSQQKSIEARLSSSGHGPLTWTVGVYFFNEQQYYDINFELSPQLASFTSYPDVGTTSKAVFGQATYSILPNLRLTGGLRYTRDHKTSYDGAFGVDAFLGVGSSGLGPVLQSNAAQADKSWSDISWKVGVDADIARDVLGYASVSTGYKAGGFFSGLPPTNTYAPERLFSYVAGVKSTLFDRKLQFNAEAFYWDYRDYQVSDLGVLSSPPNPPGLLTLLTFNAGAAHIYGLETETAWKPTAADRFDVNLSYLHAEFAQLAVGGLPGPTTGDFSGSRLPHSPRFSGTLAYLHTFYLADKGALDALIQTHFETNQFLQYYYRAVSGGGVTQDAFTRSDAFLTYHLPGGAWRLTGYIKNMENSAVANFAGESPSQPGAFYGELDPPRTFGVIASVQW